MLTWAKMPRWIVADGLLGRMTPTETKTLMTIIAHTDADGYTSQSYGEIADITKVDARSVKRSIKSLVTSGVIEVHAPARGRSAATYRVDPNRRGDSCVTNTDALGDSRVTKRAPVVGTAVSPQDEGGQQCPPNMSPREPVVGTRVSPIRTYIGTPVRRLRREREDISLSLPDFARALLDHYFPAKLVPLNWPGGALDTLAENLARHTLTTHWQIDRLIRGLSQIPRKFQVPTTAEVFAALDKLDKANRSREAWFQPGIERADMAENIEPFGEITAGLSDERITALLSRTRDHLTGTQPATACRLWDPAVKVASQHAVNDLLIDPLCDQLAARGLRQWVITMHKRTEVSA